MAGQGGQGIGGAFASTTDYGRTAQQHGPLGAVVVAVEQAEVAAEAGCVRDAGDDAAGHAKELVAALEEASAAAAGVRVGAVGGLLTGAALAECAAVLARRAADTAAETAALADAMTRAAGLLVEVDGEVAHRVAGAAG